VSTDEPATSAESVPSVEPGASEDPAASEEPAAVVESDDGWIGDDLLGGEEETVVLVVEDDQGDDSSVAQEASPTLPTTREEAADSDPKPTPAAAGTTIVGRPQPEPPSAPVPVSDAERAMAILRQAARSPDPSIRANAIESLLASPGTLEEVVTAGLVDSNRGVRFVAAMCIGRARLSNLSHLVEPLVRDSSPSVRAAAIYALRRCGRPADPTVLATMLRSDDPEIRSNAFAVLGELGDRSAAPMVREALGFGMRRVNPIRVRIVELQGAETLVRLGSEEDIEAIRAALFAPVEQGELSILACQVLARVGDQSSVPMLERLVMASGTSARPPEIRLAAAQAIAELGARTQIDLLGLASNAARAPDPLVRMQAASVLGCLGGSAAEAALATMMSDPVESVRVTAAGNLLRLSAESASPSSTRPMR
jgi:HEAT repeat protein